MINKLFYRFGSWGICFTYGTWFAIEGLSAVGQSYGTSTCIRKACKFLLTKQLKNGGWGESHLSSRTKVTISVMLLQCRWTASFIKNQAKECLSKQHIQTMETCFDPVSVELPANYRQKVQQSV